MSPGVSFGTVDAVQAMGRWTARNAVTADSAPSAQPGGTGHTPQTPAAAPTPPTPGATGGAYGVEIAGPSVGPIAAIAAHAAIATAPATSGRATATPGTEDRPPAAGPASAPVSTRRTRYTGAAITAVTTLARRGPSPGTAIHRQPANAPVTTIAALGRITAAAAVPTARSAVPRCCGPTFAALAAITADRPTVTAAPAGAPEGSPNHAVGILSAAAGTARLGVHPVGAAAAGGGGLSDNRFLSVSDAVIAVAGASRQGRHDRAQALAALAARTTGPTGAAGTKDQTGTTAHSA